jgi:hypothetical protein
VAGPALGGTRLAALGGAEAFGLACQLDVVAMGAMAGLRVGAQGLLVPLITWRFWWDPLFGSSARGGGCRSRDGRESWLTYQASAPHALVMRATVERVSFWRISRREQHPGQGSA